MLSCYWSLFNSCDRAFLILALLDKCFLVRSHMAPPLLCFLIVHSMRFDLFMYGLIDTCAIFGLLRMLLIVLSIKECLKYFEVVPLI